MPSDLATWVAAAYAEITVSQQPASAGDASLITTKAANLVADLALRRVYSVADTAAIPDAVFPDLTHILAEHSAPLFGKEINVQKIRALEDRLRELDRATRTGTNTLLVQEVFNLLSVWGQPANAVDTTTVLNHASYCSDELQYKRVILIPDVSNVANGVVSDFARYIAATLAQPNAVMTKPVLLSIKEDAEKNLREIDRATLRGGSTALARRVTELLEVYGQGRNIMDQTAIAAHASDMLEELAARGVIPTNDISSIDAEYLPNLSRYIAAGLSSPPLYPIMDRSAKELRAQTRTRVDSELVQAKYY